MSTTAVDPRSPLADGSQLFQESCTPRRLCFCSPPLSTSLSTTSSFIERASVFSELRSPPPSPTGSPSSFCAVSSFPPVLIRKLIFPVYCRYVDGSACWGGWDRRCLERWGSFFKLAVPGILHVGTEWCVLRRLLDTFCLLTTTWAFFRWAFEIVALAAGRLGDLPLSAQSVIMTVDQVRLCFLLFSFRVDSFFLSQILNTLPFGVGVAASSRIGNLLGSQSPSHARLSSHASVALSTIIGGAVLGVLMATRESFGYLFSSAEDVVKLVADVLPYVAAFQIADGWAQRCVFPELVLRKRSNSHSPKVAEECCEEWASSTLAPR